MSDRHIIPTERVKEPKVRDEKFWWQLITGIQLTDLAAKKPKGRLFGPRDKNYPV
jgi:hypothetical protein